MSESVLDEYVQEDADESHQSESDPSVQGSARFSFQEDLHFVVLFVFAQTVHTSGSAPASVAVAWMRLGVCGRGSDRVCLQSDLGDLFLRRVGASWGTTLVWWGAVLSVG